MLDYNYKLKYEVLDKYRWLYSNHLLDEIPILKLEYKGNNEGLVELIDDCKNIFNIKEEAVLNIDLTGYKDSFMLTTLTGAPPGYVGYEDEGVLSKHILSYPVSIIVFKGFKYACNNISNFIINLINNGFFTDQKSRLISLKNTIIIVEGINNKNSLGFNDKIINNDNIFDEVIENKNNLDLNLNQIYQKALSRLNYEISFDFDINSNNKRKVNSYLYEFTKNNIGGKYEIHKEDI